MLSCVWFFMTPWTVVHQAPLSMGFFRQNYWSVLPFPSPFINYNHMVFVDELLCFYPMEELMLWGQLSCSKGISLRTVHGRVGEGVIQSETLLLNLGSTFFFLMSMLNWDIVTSYLDSGVLVKVFFIHGWLLSLCFYWREECWDLLFHHTADISALFNINYNYNG